MTLEIRCEPETRESPDNACCEAEDFLVLEISDDVSTLDSDDVAPHEGDGFLMFESLEYAAAFDFREATPGTDVRRRSSDGIAPHEGDGFLMFENLADASAFDFSDQELNPLVRFLNALYIPKHIKQPLADMNLPRTSTGNRVNPLTLAWDQAESSFVMDRWRDWVKRRHRKSERKALAFRQALAMGTLFALFVCFGLAAQKSVRTQLTEFTASSIPIATATAPNKSAPVIAPPVIEHDESGQVVRVYASDPRSVLLGFCREATDGFCEPVELAWSSPPHPEVRFGVFRSFYDLRAIEIHRDSRTRQWYAGDGREPIEDFLTSIRPMSANRVPVGT